VVVTDVVDVRQTYPQPPVQRDGGVVFFVRVEMYIYNYKNKKKTQNFTPPPQKKTPFSLHLSFFQKAENKKQRKQKSILPFLHPS